MKLTLDYIKNKTEEIEPTYKCKAKEYKNNYTKIPFECGKGHEFWMTWGNFSNGSRCSVCWKIERGEKRKLSYEYVKNYINSTGEELISKKYKKAKEKLRIKCRKEGHIYLKSFDCFQRGQRCTICSNKKLGMSILNENHHNWRGGENTVWYDTYALKIDWCEEIRRDPKNPDYLQVRCTESSCRKWFNPTNQEVRHRIDVIDGNRSGGSRFYCSEECKQKCSLYSQQKYPKGFKQDNSRPDQSDWAKMVLERDNYTCQKCDSKENLEAHHIEGIYENPLMSADIDLGITLCKKCHKEAHRELGCRYVDLQKQNLCNGGL